MSFIRLAIGRGGRGVYNLLLEKFKEMLRFLRSEISKKALQLCFKTMIELVNNHLCYGAIIGTLSKCLK